MKYLTIEDVFLIEGERYHSMAKKLKTGEKRNYPIATEEELNTLKEQFFNSWCITKDKENEVILIHNHY